MSGILEKSKAKFHHAKEKFPRRGRWTSYIEDFKRKSPKERAAERDALNTGTMLSKAVEITENNVSGLEVCDFLIVRFVKNKEEEKYHDHFAFIKERDSDGIKVIFITDIMKDKPEETTWTFQMLSSNMREEKIEIIQFNLMDLQDEDELIVERASAYKIPPKETRPLHFAYICSFGVKEPVFSEDHLSLCDDNTLLLLRTESEDTPVLLHRAIQDKLSASYGKFLVSFKESDSDVKVLSFVELMNVVECTVAALYYYPGLKLESLEKLYKKPEHGKSHDAAHHTMVVSAIHTVEHEVKHAIQHEMVPLLAPELAGMASLVFGAGIHGFIAVAGASISTHKAGKKEMDYKVSGGTKGFSRTRRNKEVSAKWSGAVAGTAGSIGAAALVGQVLIPVPGVGAMVGAVVGGVIGALIATYATVKASNKIYDKNMQRKCPLCPISYRQYSNETATDVPPATTIGVRTFHR